MRYADGDILLFVTDKKRIKTRIIGHDKWQYRLECIESNDPADTGVGQIIRQPIARVDSNSFFSIV